MYCDFKSVFSRLVFQENSVLLLDILVFICAHINTCPCLLNMPLQLVFSYSLSLFLSLSLNSSLVNIIC